MPNFLFSTPAGNGTTDFYETDGTANGTEDLGLGRFPYTLPGGELDPVIFNGETAFLGDGPLDGPGAPLLESAVMLTDGTAAGTEQTLIGGNGGPASTDTLDVVGGYLVTSGSTEIPVGGVWSSSDGKTFTEILQGVRVNPAVAMAVSNNVGFFQGLNSSGQNDGLWRTDGTAAGTRQLDAGADPLVIAGVSSGAVFFNQNSGGTISLMFSDGGSTLSTISNASIGSFTDSRAVLAASAGGKAYLSGVDSAGNFAVFATDGTDAGTVEVYTGGNPSGPTRNPVSFVPFGNKMLFDNGYGAVVTDGTKAGTVQLTNGLSQDIVAFGTKALIYVTELQPQPTLYVTDGTTAGTKALTIPGLAANGILGDFTVVSNQVVFVGTDTSGKTAFFVTDGTAAGSHELSLPANITLNPSSLPDILALPNAPPAAGQVVTLGSGNQSYAASSGDTVFAGAGNDTIAATSGGVEAIANSGSLVFVGGSTPSTVAGGTGTDTIFGGSGGGDYGGASGGHNILISQGASGANTTLTGGGAGDELFGSAAGNDILIAAVGRESVLGGGGHTTIDGGGTAASVIFTGSGATDYFGGVAGGDTVVGGSGALDATLQKGDAVFAGSGAAAVTGSTSGADSIVGGAGSLSVTGKGGNMLVVSGTATNSINTGSGASLIFQRTGATTLTGGAGSMEVIAGKGNLTVSEGSGPATYDVISGQVSGTDIISGFKVGIDSLNLLGYRPSQIGQTVSGGNTVINLSDGTKIELVGVTNAGHSIVG